jgi:hypothetical protein
MGLLDDAIREHLDLKRRRGADPTEIARLEQEALGPVRREPEPPAHEEAHPEAEPVHHGAVAEEPAHEQPQEAPVQEDTLFDESERPPADEVQPELEPAKAQGDALLQPTTEYRVEDQLDEDDEPVPTVDELDEDVLEETPDFLQETPEHDRLWFEQRPPRDFDFDG